MGHLFLEGKEITWSIAGSEQDVIWLCLGAYWVNHRTSSSPPLLIMFFSVPAICFSYFVSLFCIFASNKMCIIMIKIWTPGFCEHHSLSSGLSTSFPLHVFLRDVLFSNIFCVISGSISAFSSQFPVSVAGWNAATAIQCSWTRLLRSCHRRIICPVALWLIAVSSPVVVYIRNGPLAIVGTLSTLYSSSAYTSWIIALFV